MSTKEKCHDLVWKYHSTKSQDTMAEIIKMNKGYINKLAITHYTKYNKMCEIEDLKQECVLGLMQAVERFDFDKDTTLLTYADLWMRSYMFDLYWRNMPVHIPAHLVRKMLYSKTKEQSKYLHDALQATKTISYNAFYSTDSKDVLVSDRHLAPDTTMILFERHHIPLDFERAFNEMTPLQRDVINFIYLNYKTDEISEMTNIAPANVRYALKKAKKIIRKHLSENTHVPEVIYEAA